MVRVTLVLQYEFLQNPKETPFYCVIYFIYHKYRFSGSFPVEIEMIYMSLSVLNMALVSSDFVPKARVVCAMPQFQ